MDDEITGMFQIAKILDDMDDETRSRVVRWAADKYGVDLGQVLAAGEEEGESTDQTMFLGVDPEKVAAAKAARDADRAEEQASAPNLEVKPASTMESTEVPPERDPEKPSFLDTSFRMYSGKQQLKKEKDPKD